MILDAAGPTGRRLRPRQRPARPRPALRHRLDEAARPSWAGGRATPTSARAWRRRSGGTAPTRLVAAAEGGHRGQVRRSRASEAPMRLLVTGAGGQLGHDVVAAATAAGDDVVGVDHAALDVTDRDAVLGAITTWRPDAVVHCAAWTAVDACEGDPGAGVHGQRPRRALGRRGVRPRRRPPRARVDRLRLRRRARPPVPRVGRDRTRARSTARRSWPASARRWRSARGRRRAHVVGVRRARLEHGRARCCAWRRDRDGPGGRAGVRRRPARPPDVHGRPRPAAAPARPRPALGRRPRHEPGRGVVVRVRRRGPRAPPGYDRAMVRPITTRRARPAAPGAAPGQQRARQRRPARRRHPAAARLPRSRSPSSSPACAR